MCTVQYPSLQVSWKSCVGFIFMHFADAFIQSDFQYTFYKDNPLEQAGVKCLTQRLNADASWFAPNGVWTSSERHTLRGFWKIFAEN